jgi:hypothetical protein
VITGEGSFELLTRHVGELLPPRGLVLGDTELGEGFRGVCWRSIDTTANNSGAGELPARAPCHPVFAQQLAAAALGALGRP